jgi:hypothetical protein
MTDLEETCYHRLNPFQGFGVQRVFTEDGSLEETISVADHDVVLISKIGAIRSEWEPPRSDGRTARGVRRQIIWAS